MDFSTYFYALPVRTSNASEAFFRPPAPQGQAQCITECAQNCADCETENILRCHYKCTLKARGSTLFQHDLATDSLHQLLLVCGHTLCLFATTDGANARLVRNLAQHRPLRNSTL